MRLSCAAAIGIKTLDSNLVDGRNAVCRASSFVSIDESRGIKPANLRAYRIDVLASSSRMMATADGNCTIS